MAAMDFIEFDHFEDLQEYCDKNLLVLRQRNGYSVIADVLGQNGALLGYISNRPEGYKTKKLHTKYVLVWE